jgi:hypothetical protein
MLGAWLFAIGRSKPGTGGGATLPPSTGLLEEEGRGRREAAREPYGSRPQAMSGDYQQTWVEQSHRPPSRDNHVETTFEAVYVDQSNDGGGGF